MRLTKLALALGGCLAVLACSDGPPRSPLAPPLAPLFSRDGRTCSVPASYATIQAAVANVACTTIDVAAGTYTEVGQIVINRNLTIVGANKTTTIIKPDQNTGDPLSGDSRAWFLVNSNFTFNLSKVTLDGSGKLVAIGILSRGNGTIENNVIKNIGYNPSTDYYGRGIELFNTNMTVRDNTLQNIGRIGIFDFGPDVTSAIIEGNNYTGKGTGNWLDYGIELGGGAVATISNNTISRSIGIASVDASTSAGILVTTFFASGTQATITGNTLTNNTDGIAVGFDASDVSVVTATNNSIAGNDFGIETTAPVVNATCNWWGAADGPGPVGLGSGDKVSTNVDFTPWLTTSHLNGPCTGGTNDHGDKGDKGDNNHGNGKDHKDNGHGNDQKSHIKPSDHQGDR